MGNSEIVIGIIESIVRSLPNSRLQRDLKDSTITRSSFMIFGYITLIVNSLSEGVTRLEPCKEVIRRDVENNTQVLMEGVQTFLRLKGYNHAYEMCKDVLDKSSYEIFTMEIFRNLVDLLPIEDNHKRELNNILSPSYYTGKYPPFADV
jgi:adenylosuccinate lyase